MRKSNGETLQRTPLYEEHRALGAKLVEFGGWEMPVSYRGIMEEHRAVRTAAGLFDVSHMGEIEVLGPHAGATCQRLTCNDVRRLANGHVQYTLLCREDGGVVDDVTLYRVNEQRYFFCVNASNIAKDLAWIQENAGPATIVDRSAVTALIALQGPAAVRILERLTPLTLSALKSFRFARTEVAGLPAFISRTGYTGEDGFEIYVDESRAVTVWTALMAAGTDDGLEPIGLGARDTLRLEAALPLYGHELDDQTSPLAAGLARFVKLDGEEFLGRSYLLHEEEQGTPRRLVGLKMRGPGIARQGYPVVFEGATVGIVTSGTHSPTLGEAVALAYVTAPLATLGTLLAVQVRGRAVPAEVIPTPFYRRARPASAPVPVPEALPASGADDEATAEVTTEPVAPIELTIPVDEADTDSETDDVPPAAPEGES
ncbi:MAG: glycine cleavage system aminomethyltransferase GcvT [Candidatus Binatia bacterium]